MGSQMSHTEWRALADRTMGLEPATLYTIVLQFLNVTDTATATSAIEAGLVIDARERAAQARREQATRTTAVEPVTAESDDLSL